MRGRGLEGGLWKGRVPRTVEGAVECGLDPQGLSIFALWHVNDIQAMRY